MKRQHALAATAATTMTMLLTGLAGHQNCILWAGEAVWLLSLRPDTPIEEMYQIVGRTRQDVWTRIAGIIGAGKSWEETQADYEKNWKPNHDSPIDYRG